MNFLIISAFVLELFVLCYVEKKIWNSIFTPLFFLMLPYSVVLFATILLSGNSVIGLKDFYYPSVIIWCIGLLVFSIPSFVLGYIRIHNSWNNRLPVVNEDDLPYYYFWFILLLSVLFVLRFRSMSFAPSNFVGSEEFADEFSAHGLWAHLRQIMFSFFIIGLYLVDRNHKRMWFIILSILFVLIINQVKGNILIAIVTGVSMRVCFGKTRITWKLALGAILGAFGLFLVSYAILPILGKGTGKMTGELWLFVFRTFVHYLTSGVQGLSIDMVNGFPDAGHFQIIISPLVNLLNTILGNGNEILSPVNSFYFHSGINFTNVRTFFGTLYIYSDSVSFVLYSLFLSTFLYLLRIGSVRMGNIYIYAIYFYYISLLAMGWFEFYFFHLNAIEIPIILILAALFDYFVKHFVFRTENGTKKELGI